MDFDLLKASSKLSEMDLKITSGNLGINILWFRAIHCTNDIVIERHTHSTFEFHFIYAGSSMVILDDGSFEAQAGEFYLTSPGVYHRQEIQKRYIEFSLNCELNALDEHSSEAQYMVNILKNAVCKSYKDIAGATGFFYKALEEAYFQNIGYYNNIAALTVMLVSSASRAISGFTQASYCVPKKKKKDEYRYIQIQDYIRSNVYLPISTSDIARHMFLGEKQISRIVYEAIGISTKELIQSFKLKKARELLIEKPELSIREISELMGFSSEYYFSQFFKRNEGFPPGVFRSNVQLY